MNIGQSFEKLKNEMFIRYRGCLIEKVGNGFKTFGEVYSSIELAKTAVDNRYQVFYHTIKNNQFA